MATTPTYGWPYQTLSDPPNGPSLGELLALGIEATVAALDGEVSTAQADIAALQALLPYRARQTLAAPATTVSFTGIPSTLRSLQVQWRARGDSATNGQNVTMQVNASAAAIYDNEYTQSVQNGAPTSVPINNATAQYVGIAACATSAGVWSTAIIDFPSWDITTGSYLVNLWRHGAHDIAAAGSYTTHGKGSIALAGPYTRVDLFIAAGNFIVGSDFQIIGERA